MMGELVTGDTITTAWIGALERLVTRGGEAFDLLVTIEDQNPAHADPRIIAVLDQMLTRRKAETTGTVSNTIFPERLARTSPDHETLCRRYRAMLPRLKRIEPKNRRGTYFERLIAFPLQPDPGRGNQLEDVIRTLRGELARDSGALAHVYEAQIFAPGRDRRPIGFPCMSSLSFHLDRGRLRLSATYRNEYYIRKALGNFLGLAHLQQYVATEGGIESGVLSVHAFHAQIDPDVAQRDVIALCACKEPIPLQLVNVKTT